jgi:nucleoside-diphosphate-sugar epimerase
MIARAYSRQTPFEVWGDGQQIRNWTHVSDIVSGLILAAETVSNGSAINLGTMERIKVIDAAKMACEFFGHKVNFLFKKDAPVGPVNRVADNSLAKRLLGWEPKIKFSDGLLDTAEWYASTHTRDEAEEEVKTKLLRR